MKGKIGLSERITAGFVYHVECFDKNGNLKWEDTAKNLITADSLNDIIDVYLRNQTQTATWYVGLTSGTPTVNSADTMSFA